MIYWGFYLDNLAADDDNLIVFVSFANGIKKPVTIIFLLICFSSSTTELINLDSAGQLLSGKNLIHILRYTAEDRLIKFGRLTRLYIIFSRE